MATATGSAEAQAKAARPQGRRYLKAAERRQLILQAAKEVFARTSLQGATTREIARAANVNQATLFEHFDSKEMLFFESVVRPMLGAMSGMQARREQYKNTNSFDEFIEASNDSTMNHLKIMMDIFPLLVTSLFSDQAMGQKLYLEQIAPFMLPGDGLDEILRQEIDREFAGLAMFGVFFAIAMNEHFRGRSTDLGELARKATEFMALGFIKDEFRGGRRPAAE